MKRIALLPAGPIAPSTSRFVCADSDQDGRQEVIFRTGSIRPEDPLRVEIWEYRPVNRFELVFADTGAYPYPPGITTGNLRISDCGDLDADSLFDLTGLNKDKQGDSLYDITPMHESPTRHQYPESLVWYARTPTGWPRARHTGDLDADGREELMVPSDIGLLVYENVGGNQNELVWRLPPGSVDGFELAIEDSDGDGYREFLTAGIGNGVVSLFKCVGDNQYELAWQDTVGLPNGHDVFSGRNFDVEGKPRFFVRFKVTPWNRWYLYMWESVGNNRFLRVQVDEKTLSAQGVSSRSVCGDLDGDGFSEVVWAVPIGLFIYKPTGHNQFEQVWTWWDDHGTHLSVDTRIRDMNNNGYNNLVVAGSFKTSVFEVEAVRVLSPNGGEELVAGDTCRIRWRTFNPPRCDSVSLFLLTDTGVPEGEWFWRMDTIATGLAPTESSHAWVVPDTVLSAAWIVAMAHGPGWQHDNSDGPLRIVPPGVEEAEALAWEHWQPQTVLRGNLPVPEGIHALLFDAAGRKVMELQPGENDVRRLAPGVYFVRRQDTGESARLVLAR
ncbi:MAG: hypothetical protein R6X12_06170 [bacterium]